MQTLLGASRKHFRASIIFITHWMSSNYWLLLSFLRAHRAFNLLAKRVQSHQPRLLEINQSINNEHRRGLSASLSSPLSTAPTQRPKIACALDSNGLLKSPHYEITVKVLTLGATETENISNECFNGPAACVTLASPGLRLLVLLFPPSRHATFF
jgi:hypothetical protein